MTLVAERLEALVVARAHTATAKLALGDLVKPLTRFAPAELTAGAWRDRLAEVVAALRAQGALDADQRVRDPDELARRIGGAARSWPELSDRVLPALALGIAAGEVKLRARLDGRDAWAAAIVGRALGVWRDGPPPSLPAMCDALVWRELGLPGKPKRCPPELRALFVQRRLGSEAGPPERLVRVLAAREVDAPRPELRALRDALVRGWLAGRVPGEAPATTLAAGGSSAAVTGREGAPPSGDEPGSSRLAHATPLAAASLPAAPASTAPGPATPGPAASAPAAPGPAASAPAASAPAASAPAASAPAAPATSFAADVLRAAGAVTDGWFGDRKVFVSAVWDQLRRDPRWAELAPAEFKARLLAAHRAGELALARADLVAAMDPALVAASEVAADGARFHFLVVDPRPEEPAP